MKNTSLAHLLAFCLLAFAPGCKREPPQTNVAVTVVNPPPAGPPVLLIPQPNDPPLGVRLIPRPDGPVANPAVIQAVEKTSATEEAPAKCETLSVTGGNNPVLIDRVLNRAFLLVDLDRAGIGDLLSFRVEQNCASVMLFYQRRTLEYRAGVFQPLGATARQQ